MIEHSRAGRLFLTVACFVLSLHLPAGAVAVSLEETKNLQDPFAFSRQLDYRHFDWFDYKGAEIDDVAIYQFRYTHPVSEGEVLPEQFIRLTTSVQRTPVFNQLGQQDGSATGMGDTNIFDAFTLWRGKNYKWGIGPSITIPTNQNHGRKKFGNDNWLAGIAGIGMFRFAKRDQYTIIFNWQKDVHGDDVPYEKLNFQPAFMYNLNNGWFFISSGIWQFDLENDTHFIPIALGLGKAFRLGGKLMYCFVEPQWVVEADDTDKHGNFTPQPDFFVRVAFTTRIGS